MRIVIVDSTDARRRSLERTLRAMNMDLTLFESMQDADGRIRRVAELVPDLLLLHLSDQMIGAAPTVEYLESALSDSKAAIVVCYSGGGVESNRVDQTVTMERRDYRGVRWTLHGEASRRVLAVWSAVNRAEDLPLRDIVEAVTEGVGRLADFIERPRSLRILPALVILCQGYVAAQFVAMGNDSAGQLPADTWSSVRRAAGLTDGLRETLRRERKSEARSLGLRDWRMVLGDITPESELFNTELRDRPASNLVGLVKKINASQEPTLTDVANAYLDLVGLLRGDAAS
jgi:hypothetical protein